MENLSTWLCFGIPLVVVLGFLIIRGNEAEERRKAMEAARITYQGALSKLKRQPTDPTLRQQALEAGRAYASLSRENKGATIFDEVALKNDLDAATAGASVVAAAPAPATDVAERLRSLDGLKAQGLITEDEYQARRAKILEGV